MSLRAGEAIDLDEFDYAARNRGQSRSSDARVRLLALRLLAQHRHDPGQENVGWRGRPQVAQELGKAGGAA